MDRRQLEYFVAVVEELSFTRAAARCHVVQSALSYQIARLEHEQAVTLFERTSRSVRLTAAGEVLLPRAHRVLGEIAAAQAELAELAGVITGRLRLGMIGSAGKAAPVVERALADFHRLHPGVEIVITDSGSGHMAELVRTGELDLALVGLYADQVAGDLVHRVVAEEPLVVILPAGRAGARTTTPSAASAADLASVAAATPFVDMRPESGLRQQVDAVFVRAGVTRRIGFELASSDAIVRFVGLGFGAAVVPRSAAVHTDVVTLALGDRAARHPISLVHRQPEPSAPSARSFLRVLDGSEPETSAGASGKGGGRPRPG